ncbi:MAG: DNA internalization-related competence protein ComEC/Rec2 [Halanaerobiales bacterium]|nr:DNA internalization-related competence protein ComEC/Rec2 [Halanaerobiales bacterium]
MKLNKNIIIAVIIFILGIISGYFFINYKLVLLITGIILLIIITLTKNKKIVIYIFIIIFLFGFFYMLYFQMNYYSINSINNYNNRIIEVVGKIKIKLDSVEGNSVILKPILVDNKRIKYGNIQLWKSDLNNNIEHGDLVIARMKLNKPQKASNPGGFSYFKYLKKKKIYSVGNVFEIYKIQNHILLTKPIIKIKRFLLGSIDKKIIPPVNEFIKALILGEKSNLNKSWETSFRRAGANHLLAISGLHIGFITLFIIFLLKPFSFSSKIINIILTFFLLIYVIMTGFRASVLRASLLVLFFRYFKQINLKVDFFTIISIVLFIILLLDPYKLFSVGLQLSFLVLLMIVSWTKIFERYLHTSLAVSLAAQLGSIPLTAYYFNTISPAGVITNLWAIPLVSVIVFLTLTHFVFYLIFPFLSNFTGQLIYLTTVFLNKGIKVMSKLPSAEIKVTTPSIATVFIYYIILFLVAYIIRNKDNMKSIKINIFKILSTILLIIFIFTIIIRPTNNNLLEIYCLDVGQGDSIVIKIPDGQTILVDTGSSTLTGSKAEKTIIPFLLNQNIKMIDYHIVTHFDGDHSAGTEYLIKKGFIKNLIISKQYDFTQNYAKKTIEAAMNKNIRVYWTDNQDILSLNNIKLKFMAPLENIVFKNRNNYSVAFKLTYKDFEMLFTGDLEEKAEEIILKLVDQNKLKSDILKVAHHGSETSSTDEFIKAVAPKEAIISVGSNEYGHPSKNVLKRLIDNNIRIWRTDHNGAVIIKTDGHKYNINGYLN